MHKVTLQESNRGRAMLERTPRYEVRVNGELFGMLVYNMRGFIGYLPMADGRRLDIGERPIGDFRREIARINRESK